MFQQFIKQYRYYPIFIWLFITFIITSCSEKKFFESDNDKVSIKESGKDAEVKNEDEEVKVEGDETQGQVIIKTKNGDSTIAYNKNTLAAGFPQDIPIYTPSTVQMSQISDKGKTVMARLNTFDDIEKAVQFYKKTLPQAGWEVKGEMNVGSTALLQGERGEKELNVCVKREQGETVISLAERNK